MTLSALQWRGVIRPLWCGSRMEVLTHSTGQHHRLQYQHHHHDHNHHKPLLQVSIILNIIPYHHHHKLQCISSSCIANLEMLMRPTQTAFKPQNYDDDNVLKLNTCVSKHLKDCFAFKSPLYNSIFGCLLRFWNSNVGGLGWFWLVASFWYFCEFFWLSFNYL